MTAVQRPRGRELLIGGVWQVGSNWNMRLLYEGGDEIVQSLTVYMFKNIINVYNTLYTA